MKKRLFVLSVDAMVHEDIAYLRSLPNFKKYLEGGSEVKKIRTIYPTVTYPSHVSIMTGCYPDKHGVISNNAFTTDNKEDTWNWFHDNVKVEDIFTAAKKAGYKTASVFWTVTGNHRDIDYLINEYWLPNKDDTLLESFKRAGSSDEVLKIIDKNKNLLPDSYTKTGRTNVMIHPEIDNFLITCTCDIIRQFKPEVVFVHNGNIDDARHKNGVFNQNVTEGLKRVDDWFGELMAALEDAGVLKDTNIIIVSDHGQIDITRVIKPNVFLVDHGFITLSPEGKVLDWKAYSFSNAMSAMVFLKDPNDKKTYDEVYTLLKSMRDEGIYGFSEVYTREELAEKEHLDGDFAFVLETDGYTSFSDSCVRPVVNNFDLSDYRFGRATHGYYPDKGPQPVFIAKGPDIKNGIELEQRPIVDEAPTFARILGVELPNADGTAIEEILR